MTSEQLKTLVNTVQQLSLARDINKVMEVVRKSARNLTQADGATFVLKDNDLCYYADEDAIEPLWKGQRFPMSACISGWAMIHHTPAVVADIYEDDRIPIDTYKPTFIKSLVTVPIRKMDPIGAIGNYWAKRHLPTDEEIQLLQSLADITSVSIENIYVYNELEERVKQRTEQLEMAYKEMEAFSYSISHDLRAPLRAINGYAKILDEDYGSKLDDEARRIINKVTNNASRMENLIDDLLTFSRISRKDLNKTRVDMNQVAHDVLIELSKSFPHQTKVNIKKLHSVLADQNLIYQVMFNLISNAVKYSSKKENPLVEVSSSEQNGEIIFSIKDNGVGFDMKYADKLFDVFQRLHSSNEFEGTGVGLALVKSLVNKHGGNVWGEAKIDEGATFYFSLQSDNELLSSE